MSQNRPARPVDGQADADEVAAAVSVSEGDCLLIIDVQNDFCAGGALAVPDGDAVVAPINTLARRFGTVVLTQDWHPAGHSSFASEHPDRQPFDSITLPYGEQTLWPDHCLQGTEGAAFHAELDTRSAQLIVRKGFRTDIDSYSAFQENDHATTTGLADWLRARSIRRVICVGLALDYCVAFTALDAVAAGFETVVIESACRAIDLQGSLASARHSLQQAGVQLQA